MPRTLELLCLLLVTAGMAVPSPARAAETAATTSSALVYGDDSRAEARAESDPGLRELARKSTVAIIPREALVVESDAVFYDAPPLAEESALCPGQPFEDQPVLARCTGVLVMDDVVLTAGHCMDDENDCSGSWFVLDYTLDESGEVLIEPGNVFGCERVLARELSSVGEPVVFDHALVKLDRPVLGRGTPVPVRGNAVEPGEALVLIGNGLGLPTKIDAQGRAVLARSTQADYFGAEVDNFHRGSGSPIFDVWGLLVGIAVRGGVDFDGTGTCQFVRSVASGTATMEQASYAGTALIRSGYGDQVVTAPPPRATAAGASAQGCSFAGVHGAPPIGLAASAFALLLLLGARKRSRPPYRRVPSKGVKPCSMNA